MRLLFFGILCAFCCMSCSSDEIKSYSAGSDFIDNDIQVRVIDTFSIKTGTFKLDSLITSSTNRILLGSVIDDNLGHLTAKSYFQLTSSSFSINSNAVYDSIGMILNYDTYYYGDTTKVQTYKLHRIIETVKPEEGNVFYNTSILEYDSETLGELSFAPNPNRTTDSLYIPINNELGEDLFTKIVDNNINNSDDFTQYFKGLAIVPDTTLNSHILGFNSSTTEKNSSMRLYYTINDNDNEDNSYYIDFVISNTSKQFNSIEADLSSTIVDEFENGEEVKLSENTNNLIFTQAGTGISSRIEIPSIKKLSDISDTGSVLSAELSFTPLKGSYSEGNPLEESLLIYIVDHKNRIIKELTDIDGNISYAVLNQNGDEFDDNTYYTIDLSGYVEEILYTNYDLNYALMIQFVDYNKTVSNLVIGNDNNKVKLTVKYLNY